MSLSETTRTPRPETTRTPRPATDRTPRPDRPSRQRSALRRWLRNSSRPGAWVTYTLLGFSLLFCLLTFVLPPRDYSERENRKLADAPSLSVGELADGSFARGAEHWFSDHFYNRDFWMTLLLRYRTALGQKENGGVWLGKDDSLFLIPQTPDEKTLSRNLTAMDAFAAAHTDLRTYAAIIPNAFTVQPEKMPDNAPAPDQTEQLRRVEESLPHVMFLDTADALRASGDEYLFYRTDHHWTSLGAYTAFTAIAPGLGVGSPVAEYDIYSVSSGFYGTLAAKSGRFGTPDTVEIYLPKTDVIYNVTYTGTMEKTAVMYDREALQGSDHYAVFFGGNYPRVDVTTTANTGRRLLLFKDSYANCMMQFLYPYFDEIVMIDPRYYYENAEPLLRQHGITDVLYLYNCDTFLNDASLADVLAAPSNEVG